MSPVTSSIRWKGTRSNLNDQTNPCSKNTATIAGLLRTRERQSFTRDSLSRNALIKINSTRKEINLWAGTSENIFSGDNKTGSHSICCRSENKTSERFETMPRKPNLHEGIKRPRSFPIKRRKHFADKATRPWARDDSLLRFSSAIYSIDDCLKLENSISVIWMTSSELALARDQMVRDVLTIVWWEKGLLCSVRLFLRVVRKVWHLDLPKHLKIYKNIKSS